MSFPVIRMTKSKCTSGYLGIYTLNVIQQETQRSYSQHRDVHFQRRRQDVRWCWPRMRSCLHPTWLHWQCAASRLQRALHSAQLPAKTPITTQSYPGITVNDKSEQGMITACLLHRCAFLITPYVSIILLGYSIRYGALKLTHKPASSTARN